MNMFDKIKNEVLLSNFIHDNNFGSWKVFNNRMRVNPCPLCGHNDCFDVMPAGTKGHEHEWFKCQSCGKTGSIIDFYCLLNNLDPNNKADQSKALNEFCKTYGIENNINYQERPQNTSQSLSEPQKAIYSTDKHNKVVQEVKKEYDFTELAEKLHKNLISNELAMKYFLDRGIEEEIIKKFKLGFATGGVNEAFKDYPEFQQNYNDIAKEKAECYKFYIPMFNNNGKCDYILTRLDNNVLKYKLRNNILKRTDKDGKEIKYPKTINLKGVSTKIYNLEQAMKEKTIYITEGWCDALSIETFGLTETGAVALNSVASVNLFIKKIQEYKDYQTKFYVIALDNDEAGKRARKELEEKLLELKCRVKHLYIDDPNSKDVNDLLINETSLLLEKMLKIGTEIEQEKEKILIENSCYSFLDATLNRFESNKNRKIPSTGFKCLDDSLGGGLYNSLYVVGGITGLGKTSIVLNIAENLAAAGEDILFISLEMSREELIAKSLARYVRESTDTRYKKAKYLSQREIQNGHFDISDGNFQIALKKYREISKNIFVQEANFNYNTEKIREDIINHKMIRGKAPILIVDYLQVLPCMKDYLDDKKNIDFNMTELKRISREYDTPVIAISSINREYYKKQIDFNAFKSSGNIEFTADVVIGLQYSFMEDIGNMKDNEILDLYKEAKIEFPRQVQTVVLKNRNGSIGKSTHFQYEPQYNYFKEV